MNDDDKDYESRKTAYIPLSTIVVFNVRRIFALAAVIDTLNIVYRSNVNTIIEWNLLLLNML